MTYFHSDVPLEEDKALTVYLRTITGLCGTAKHAIVYLEQ